MKRRRSSAGAWSLLAFLDLITCGLGASLLLLLITSTAQPTTPPHAPDSTLVLGVHYAAPAAAGVEVGLRLRPAGDSEWTRLESESTLYGSLWRPAGGGLLAFAVLSDLPNGVYDVQPYLRDHAPSGAPPPVLAISAWGRSARVVEIGEPVDLVRPGRGGRTYQVHIVSP